LRRSAIVILIGLVLIGISYTTPLTQPQYNRRPLDITVPSQTTEPIIIEGNTQLAQQSTSGIGTRSNPYLITRLNIKVSSGGCITIRNTTSFFMLSTCVFSSGNQQDPIISLYNVENGVIEKCYPTGGSSGVQFVLCTNCSIIESVCIGSQSGITIEDSDNCTVVDCISHSNNVGISIGGRDSLVVNSSTYRNLERGISVKSYAEDTRIYHNKIGWNPVNAYSDSNTTEFTNGIDTGNSWSDFAGTGVYSIPGGASDIDSFPSILEDRTRPVIDSPSDKAFDVESVGETLTWTASDDLPYTYVLYIDGVVQNVTPWNGLAIVISLDDFPVGTYRLAMQVHDAAGNTATDDVIVTAVSFMLGGIGTELVMWASALTVVIFIGIVVLVKKAS
jgi:parallel beta-helix repeat protein